MAAGTFRSDLYYRLSVYPIQLPSLRERREDIPQLVWFFINRHQRELGRHITKVPPMVMDALQQHAWPGNVRELENVIERAMIASTGETLQRDEPLRFASAGLASSVGSDSSRHVAVQRMHIDRGCRVAMADFQPGGNGRSVSASTPNTLRFRMKYLLVTLPARLNVALHHGAAPMDASA